MVSLNATNYEYDWVPNMAGFIIEQRLMLEQATLIFEIELFLNLEFFLKQKLTIVVV